MDEQRELRRLLRDTVIYGVVVKIPNILIDKVQKYYNCDRASAYWMLIKNFTEIDLPGTSPTDDHSEYLKCATKQDFERNCTIIRLSSSQPVDGLYAMSMIGGCEYVHTQLDLNFNLGYEHDETARWGPFNNPNPFSTQVRSWQELADRELQDIGFSTYDYDGYSNLW
jgi:hypothetical protein